MLQPESLKDVFYQAIALIWLGQGPTQVQLYVNYSKQPESKKLLKMCSSFVFDCQLESQLQICINIQSSHHTEPKTIISKALEAFKESETL